MGSSSNPPGPKRSYEGAPRKLARRSAGLEFRMQSALASSQDGVRRIQARTEKEQLRLDQMMEVMAKSSWMFRLHPHHLATPCQAMSPLPTNVGGRECEKRASARARRRGEETQAREGRIPHGRHRLSLKSGWWFSRRTSEKCGSPICVIPKQRPRQCTP